MALGQIHMISKTVCAQEIQIAKNVIFQTEGALFHNWAKKNRLIRR